MRFVHFFVRINSVSVACWQIDGRGAHTLMPQGRTGGEMVGTHFGMFAQYNRASHGLINPYLVDSGGGRLKRISPAAALHGVPPPETFDAVEHPSEPTDMDEPAACPPPDNNIKLDGLILRERIARTFRRQIDRISAWQGGSDAALGRTESNPSRPPPNHSNLGGKNLFVTHSAPARVLTGMLEQSG